MARTAPRYSCTGCGATALRWAGKCSKCGEFGTIVELPPEAPAVGLKSKTSGRAPVRGARRVDEVTAASAGDRLSTGVAEFDRVIGGGLVGGQVLLLAGEPGAGKSTLLLTVADSIARRTGKPTLYISAEESVEQIAVRARRIGAGSENLLLADDNELAAIIGHLDHHGAEIPLVIVDSVQTVASADVEGRAGGVSQVMEVAQALTRVAKSRDISLCLVGQVTKDSSIAGPRSLEHIVDTVLSLEGDRQTSLRLMRAIKNRYGPADEVACFEQTDTGMVEVPDPSALFRGARDTAVPGTCVTVTIEGRRALLGELQSLVSPTTNPNPRRGVSGLDSSRVAMLTAVTERAAGLRLHDKDVFVATVGGMRITDPGSDLALCLAIASAAADRALPIDLAAIGEVTLSGDVRAMPMMAQRVAEAARLGCRRILVPRGSVASVRASAREGVVEIATLHEALAQAAR